MTEYDLERLAKLQRKIEDRRDAIHDWELEVEDHERRVAYLKQELPREREALEQLEKKLNHVLNNLKLVDGFNWDGFDTEAGK